jgi:hypothetical protein
MKRLILLIACAAAALRGYAGNYQNFNVAVYIMVQDVNTFSDPKVLQAQWDEISSQVKVDKVYIEVQRDRILADEKVLESTKAFFKSHGVQVAAGSAFSDSEAGQYMSYCYTKQSDRDFVKSVSELAARHFDEFILDDFFFVNTKYDSDIAAKGDRSWTDFRLSLMDDAAENLIVKAAKAVNPKIKVVIKFPNWYEHFQGLGFDLDREPKLFDGIYTGTETRDPSHTDQFLQQYESYQIIRYFENIKPHGNGGGWVDPFASLYVDRYAEQLWDTMFAKAHEITLFCWSAILAKAESGDRMAWATHPTSLDFNRMLYGSRGQLTWASVAGEALRQADAVVGKLGNPIGVAAYRPYQSTGEDFLHNYIGMIGIPIDLRPEFPKEAPLVLLTESAKFDPGIVAKIKGQLEAGKSVVITSGLLRALKGKGIESICETEVTDNKVLAQGYTAGMAAGDRNDLSGDPRGPGILFPEVRFLTNDAWGLVSAMENGNGYPILLLDQYSKGTLYVWTIPDNFSNLYALPEGVTTIIKDVLMKDLKVRIDGPGQVALFTYDNGTFVVESYLPTTTTVRVTVKGSFAKLRNLVTGEVTQGKPPPAPPQMPWDTAPRVAPATTVFSVPVEPHSYAAFAPEN